jgi:hypothetical protein
MRKLLGVGLILLATSVRAQTPTFIHLPRKTIEVVGLERWTVQMIQDSLNRYAPGDSLQSDACAAILRYKLHFPDAANEIILSSAADTVPYVFVSVVEPDDSARVHYRPVSLATDSASVRPEWQDGVALIRHHPEGFQMGLYSFWTRPEIPRYASADSLGVEATWTFLEHHRALQDAALARETLASDPNMYDRMAAVAVLENFPGQDSTWWALFETLRESDGFAKGTAQQVLSVLAGRAPHVDWGPEVATIHALLDGTSLFALPTVMNVLVATGVGPESARAFLKGGGHALLDYAGASLPSVRDPALRLLRALRGADLGASVGPWSAWVRSL